VLRDESSLFTHQDIHGLGTHVTGIAAGNGGGTAYVGMAPEADMIIVKATRDNATFSSADVITALQYIDAKAHILGRQYVVNMSLGATGGPADGSDAEAKAIDAIVGPGKPRKAVVVAAGNDGGKRIHARVTLNDDPTATLSQKFTVEANDDVLLQIWSQIKPNDIGKIFVTLTGPDTTFGPVSGFPTVTQNQRDGTITVVSSPHPYILTGTDIQTLVSLTAKRRGTWTVSVCGAKGQGSGNVDMWIFGSSFIDTDGDDAFLTGQPASTKNAITVGSYVTKSVWVDFTGTARTSGSATDAVSGFSSPGPARDGRQKPEISAPSEAIASTFSSTSSASSEFLLSGFTHRINLGTSMAAPHVAGAIALAFQEGAKRQTAFDAGQLRDALMNSADADANTGEVPNIKWGTGKLDTDGFFTALLGGPLTVQLASFTAATDGPRVRLTWHLAAGTGHTGFHVYRSVGLQGERLRLTEQPIEGDTTLSFTDTPPQSGTYYYWVADFDRFGRSALHGPVIATLTTVPTIFRLRRNRPNPFNPTATIECDIPRAEHVVLRIFDTLGREVRTLVDTRQPAGFHRVVWDGTNREGQRVGSGVYLYTLTAGTFTQSMRMTLLKK